MALVVVENSHLDEVEDQANDGCEHHHVCVDFTRGQHSIDSLENEEDGDRDEDNDTDERADDL
jgi:hypothetical protein